MKMLRNRTTCSDYVCPELLEYEATRAMSIETKQGYRVFDLFECNVISNVEAIDAMSRLNDDFVIGVTGGFFNEDRDPNWR